MDPNTPQATSPVETINNLQNNQSPGFSNAQENKSGSKKRIFIIALIFILIVILFLFGGLLYIMKSKQPSIIPTPTTSISPTSPANISPTKVSLPTGKNKTISELILLKGKKVEYLKTGITFTYLESEVPSSKCFDCSTSSKIAMNVNGLNKNLDYSCGGIAGNCNDTFYEQNLVIKILEIDEEKAKITIQERDEN